MTRTQTILFALGAAAFIAHAETFTVPPLTGPVVDQAGIIDPQVETAISEALRFLKQQGGSQISVLTVPDLGGLPVEQAALKVAETWRLGDAKTDRGVLFLIAKNDRQMRIEVGQGNEGNLTDVESKRIIEDQVAPYFRESRYSDGIALGVLGISAKTDPEIDLRRFFSDAPPRKQSARGGRRNHPLGTGLILFFFFIAMIINRVSRFGRSGFGRGGGYWGGGGGFGGGGPSSGGWGGGGGGFSGGGASGRW